MKKLFILLALVLPMVAFVACDNDDDLPNVKFEVTFDNPVSDGAVYVVAGDTLTVSSVTVQNMEADKKAALTEVAYFFDYYWFGTAVIAPYTYQIVIPASAKVGTHILELESNVLAVDKTPAFAVLTYKVEVVASADDLPQATTKTLTSTPTYNDKSKK